MKLFKNIIVQFTFFTFFVVFTISISLAVILSRSLTNQALAQHIDIYPKLVTSMVNIQPEILSFFQEEPPAAGNSVTAVKSFNGLLTFGTVFRVKVWRLDNSIAWSNDTEIIGKRFADNDDLAVAKGGQVHYEIALPHKSEHASEQEAARILEIYVPVKDGDRTLGVIELYEEATELFWRIERNNSIIWVLVLSAGIAIYLLLFLVFLNAHRRQRLSDERLSRTQEVIIASLAYQAEIRDMETGRHLERTSAYVRLLAEVLQRQPPFRTYLSDEYVDDLIKSSPLHDIGKVGIPDAILCKPGKLTPDEFAIMKKHCEYGGAILKMAEDKLAFRSFLTIAGQIALHHHERWDGTGYPHGLHGEQIPLSARIMALADVYDALRSERCYKKAFDHQQSRGIIVENQGTQFDPALVAAFLAQEQRFEQISITLAD